MTYSSSSTSWILTSSYFLVDSSWSYIASNHVRMIPWTCSSFTFSSCFFVFIQSFSYLTSMFYFMKGSITLIQFRAMWP
jgi:hypothetical protein